VRHHTLIAMLLPGALHE